MSTVEGTCIERQAGIPRFSGEIVRNLTDRGFKIYELTGQSWDSFPKNYSHVLINPSSLQAGLYLPKHSRRTEVAINTNMDFFFLPESCNKTFDEHMAMIQVLDKKISLMFPGTRVVMGSYLDYMEIVFQHENRDHTFATGWDMFSDAYDLKLTRAIGKGAGKSVAVGAYNSFGLTISDVGDDFKSEKLFVVPLIIPSNGK
jgi:hypothetical protein